MQTNRLSKAEREAATGLALVVGLRMFGFFLILPVFTLLAPELEGATPLLTGFALGAYGMTQAAMQIPMGMLSDYVGRKPVIIAGLIIFIGGSMVAALAQDIWGIIAGRLLQGLGAVASVSMALAADLSRDSQRGKMMAILGISIGAAFMLAMLFSPMLAAEIGLSGLFWLTAAASTLAMLFLWMKIPEPNIRKSRSVESHWQHLANVVKRPQLLRFDLAVFLLHCLLTGTFVALPVLLNQGISDGMENHWRVYIPAMLGSVLVMAPFLIMGEKFGKTRLFSLLAFGLIAICSFLFAQTPEDVFTLVLLLLFFLAGFNLLEASMPAMLSRRVTSQVRGVAMGVYTSSQFLGAFAGGLLGGYLLSISIEAVFQGMAVVALLSTPVLLGVRPARYRKDHTLDLPEDIEIDPARLAEELNAFPGIADAVVLEEQGVAYLRFENEVLDEQLLQDVVAQHVKKKS